MKMYTVLSLGETTKFVDDQKEVESLCKSGYKVVTEIEAKGRIEAQIIYNAKTIDEKEENPAKYLTITSNIFLVFSLLGCLFLLSQGYEASSSYRTKAMSPYFYSGALVSGLTVLLIHSACRVLIYIANKK